MEVHQKLDVEESEGIQKVVHLINRRRILGPPTKSVRNSRRAGQKTLGPDQPESANVGPKFVRTPRPASPQFSPQKVFMVPETRLRTFSRDPNGPSHLYLYAGVLA